MLRKEGMNGTLVAAVLEGGALASWSKRGWRLLDAVQLSLSPMLVCGVVPAQVRSGSEQ